MVGSVISVSSSAGWLWPVGSSASSSARSSPGPYGKGKDAATSLAYTIQGKGADKGTFKGKDSFPADWPPLTPGPLKALPNIHGSLPQVLQRVLLKANPMVKTLLHLPCWHLPQAVLANHKLFHFAILIAFITPPWPAWAYCPACCRALCSISPGLMLSRLCTWHLCASPLFLPCALLVASLGIWSSSSLYLFSSFSFLFLPPSSPFLGLPCLLPSPRFLFPLLPRQLSGWLLAEQHPAANRHH